MKSMHSNKTIWDLLFNPPPERCFNDFEKFQGPRTSKMEDGRDRSCSEEAHKEHFNKWLKNKFEWNKR